MNTKSTRRKFIKTVAAGMIGSGAVTQSIFAKTEDLKGGIEINKGYIVFNDTTQKNMMKLSEILIPGCSSIGMKEKLMNYFRANKGSAGFFDAGFWNIDAVSRARFKSPFYSLKDKKALDMLVKHITTENRPFFVNFRLLVVKFYFSDPKVWKKLSYNGPPQPNGFMDYAEPPKYTKGN